MYSASVLDRVIIGCFLELQETTPSPTKKVKPEIISTDFHRCGGNASISQIKMVQDLFDVSLLPKRNCMRIKVSRDADTKEPVNWF